MKHFKITFLLLFGFLFAGGQTTIKFKTLWFRPQVHILYDNVVISISLRDINRTLTLLKQSGNNRFPDSILFDTSKNYYYEIPKGNHPELHNDMQGILYYGIAAFLLYNGRAEVVIDGKKNTMVVADIEETGYSSISKFCNFYNKATNQLIFGGFIPQEIDKKDLSIDDD